MSLTVVSPEVVDVTVGVAVGVTVSLTRGGGMSVSFRFHIPAKHLRLMGHIPAKHLILLLLPRAITLAPPSIQEVIGS